MNLRAGLTRISKIIGWALGVVASFYFALFMILLALGSPILLKEPIQIIAVIEGFAFSYGFLFILREAIKGFRKA